MTDAPRPHERSGSEQERFNSADAAAARLDGAELRRRALGSLWDSFVVSLAGPKRLGTLAILVASWCGLWGSFSAANIIAGVLVGVVVMTVGLGGRRSRGGIRLVPLLKFAALVSVDLVTSTLSVMREVLTPTDYTEEGIVGVDLPDGAEHHLLLLFVAITVTPGTAVVAAEGDGRRVYLHVLHCPRRAQIEEHVRDLARLAAEALPVESGDRPTNEPVEAAR